MDEYNISEQEPATQEFGSIMDDLANYSVELSPNNEATSAALKAISKVCDININYIVAKTIIEKESGIIFSGKAWEVLEKKRLLDESGAEYKIHPLASLASKEATISARCFLSRTTLCTCPRHRMGRCAGVVFDPSSWLKRRRFRFTASFSDRNIRRSNCPVSKHRHSSTRAS